MSRLSRLTCASLLTVMVVMTLGWSGAAPPGGQQPEGKPPSEADTRAAVDELIHGVAEAKKPAMLGTIAQAIDLSISFGAPAYNDGDHAACYRFYKNTAQSLLAAFPDESSATAPARAALDDLRHALDRAKKTNDADRGAWALRFAFDKTMLAVDSTTNSAASLVQMGDEYFHRSQFQEAQDAFESAAKHLAELDGLSSEHLPPAARFASLGLANALFAQGKFEAASAAILPGLVAMPEWPMTKFDLRGLHADPAEYEAALSKLETSAKASPDSAPLQFLLGYEYYFTGKRDAAHAQFERTLKIDPNHAGAKAFIDAVKAQKPRDAKAA